MENSKGKHTLLLYKDRTKKNKDGRIVRAWSLIPLFILLAIMLLMFRSHDVSIFNEITAGVMHLFNVIKTFLGF